MVTQKAEKMLIVGASGFVGLALARTLEATQENLVLASRKKIDGFPKAKKLRGDLEDRQFCKKMVQGVSTVFYIAAFRKNIAVHTGQPFETLSKNVLPFLTFLEAARTSSVKEIIYISSTNVEYAFDADEKVDGYVYGKYLNELIAKTFTAETGIVVKIVRAPGVYGPGDSFDPKTATFISSLIARVEQAQDTLDVWGKGTRKLQFIYVDDLVRNIIATRKSKHAEFVFGNPEVVSINDVVNKIVGLIGKNLKISHDTTKPDKPTKLSTFKNLIKPRYSLDKGLRETIAYYRNHHA